MARKKWRPFPEARVFAQSLRLLDQNEWYAYCRGDLGREKGRRPDDIPACPNREYRDEGWSGMRDWLGPPPIEPVEPGFLDFKRARRFARSLELGSPLQWRRWCAGRTKGKPSRPGNIPEDPHRIYPDAWRGWGDWLGTRRGVSLGSRFLPFEEARELVRGLGLKDVKEWRMFCRWRCRDLGARPENIPANPDGVYRARGWNGFADWLGTDAISSLMSPHLPFEEARDFARSLGLESGDAWRDWIRGERPHLPTRPMAVPTNPHRTYAKCGWTDWGDFLGTGNVYPTNRIRRGFREARAWARGLSLRHVKDWREFCRGKRPDLGTRPEDVPAEPGTFYTGRGWRSWGDFLGTGNVSMSRRTFLGFLEAREFVRSLGLKGVAEWQDYTKGLLPDRPPLPDDIPVGADNYYKGRGWKGWPDFLRDDDHRRKYPPFEEARKFARRLGLRSSKEWWDWLRGERPDLPPPPEDFARTPAHRYSNHGWRGWVDFLGTENLPRIVWNFRSFREAREFARTLGLRGSAEWAVWSRGDRPDLPRRPPDIPSCPSRKYRDQGWESWPDFLDTENLSVMHRGFRSFEEARGFARSLRLRGYAEWKAWSRGDRPDLPARPPDIPSSPDRQYRDRDWKSWGDFLGTGNVHPSKRTFRAFREAREFVRDLCLKSVAEWYDYTKGLRPDRSPLPADIPTNADRYYKERGWAGWPDFLGQGGCRHDHPPFEEAREFARRLNLRSSREWWPWLRGERPDLPPPPENLAHSPAHVYSKRGWKCWGDFLGKDRSRPRR